MDQPVNAIVCLHLTFPVLLGAISQEILSAGGFCRDSH